MKRLFGLVGLTYISVLTVVFYFNSVLFNVSVIALSTVLIILAVFFMFMKKLKSLRSSLLAVGISAFCACVAIMTYTNCYYIPLLNKYSDTNLTISGYICDEVKKYDSKIVYTIKTDTINEETEHLKIQLTSYSDLQLVPFDCIKAEFSVKTAEQNSLISKKIFFTANADDDFTYTTVSEKHFSLYSLAVSVRETLKNSIQMLLPDEYASMCSAVLLGDKNALSYEIRSAFTNTGTSFLIVVSGMHLVVVVSFILFLLRKITQNDVAKFFVALISTITFMAVTGFTFSVIRAGVMLIIAYAARIFLRTSDSLNSVGFASLVITLKNPFAVGDVGLLLSITATIGIVVWSDKIYKYLVEFFKVKSLFIKDILSLIAVSISAVLWTIPISALFFERISTFVVILSLLAGPPVTVLIVCTLISALLYLIPFLRFLAYPFALICGMISKYLIWITKFFAEIPYSSLNTNKTYFYVWLLSTLFMIVIIAVTKAKGALKITACALSVVIFAVGFVINIIICDNISALKIYNVGSGVTFAVQNGNYVSVLSCGGSGIYSEDFIETLSKEFNSIELILIPQQRNRYQRYQSKLINEFDVSKILVYDIEDTESALLTEYDGQNRRNCSSIDRMNINLSENVIDNVLNIDDVTYQRIESDSCSLLFIPYGGDCSVLPEEFIDADYVLIDKIPKNSELLCCDTLIYSGTANEIKKNYSALLEMSDNIVYTNDGNISIDLN